jgi:hypothetical protein
MNSQGSRLKAGGAWLAPLRQLALLAIFLGAAAGCKISQDATAAAAQLASTSKDLSGYYKAMSGVVEDSIQLGRLQSALLGTPFGPQDVAVEQETIDELQKRSALASSLQNLSSAFSSLTGSTAPGDVATSANNLATQLVTIKALPSGPPIPELLGQAAKAIVLLVQERQERKAAKELDGLVAGVAQLFKSEEPVYESLYATYFALAGSLAKESIKRNWVDGSGLLHPALKPFDLAPAAAAAASINTSLEGYLQQSLASQATEREASQHKATEGMDEALQEMSKRIHQLATEKSLLAIGNPPTLADVEAWLLQVTAAQ